MPPLSGLRLPGFQGSREFPSVHAGFSVLAGFPVPLTRTRKSGHPASASGCDHLCSVCSRPALQEVSETIESFGETVSGSGEAQAEMRGRIEAIARSQKDSALGSRLAE